MKNDPSYTMDAQSSCDISVEGFANADDGVALPNVKFSFEITIYLKQNKMNVFDILNTANHTSICCID